MTWFKVTFLYACPTKFQADQAIVSFTSILTPSALR